MTNKSIYSIGNDAAISGKPQRKVSKPTLNHSTQFPNTPQTERSHEENQERAYVAASRRADRSIEARVQSARMASEIHKKRTGKGFRISEEIVMKEEMYEEEEEFFPRSHRLLGPHMQTASPEMNLRMEAYLTNRMAMSAMVAGNNDSWRQNDIHTQFAQCFPNANRQAQQISQRLSQQMIPSQMPQQRDLSQSPVLHSPVSPTFPPHSGRGSSFSSMPSEHTEETMSPPDSNPKTPASDHIQPDLSHQMPDDSPMDLGQDQSVFTSELPPEAKMLMGGMSMGDMSQNMYTQDWANNGPYYSFAQEPRSFKPEATDMSMWNGFYGDGAITPAKLEQQEINWGSFVNEDWDNEQQ